MVVCAWQPVRGSVSVAMCAWCMHGACRVPTWCAGEHLWCLHRMQVSTTTDLPRFLSQVSTAIEQVEMIIGRSADAEFLDVVRQLIIATQ